MPSKKSPKRSRQDPAISDWQAAQLVRLLGDMQAEFERVYPDVAYDRDLLRDTLDGETTIIEKVRSLVRDTINLGLSADALDAAAAVYREHATKPAKKAKRRREAKAQRMPKIEECLAIIGDLPDDEFTLYFADHPDKFATPPDGDALPDDYVDIVVTRVPKEDKLLADVLSGKVVEGAPPLANKGRSLRIRTN